eukprot:XP_028343429.1 uncharacterized protein LOC114485821 [Physeter catodon]
MEVEREELPGSQRLASVGMRFYPLLMAADILGQDADYVLVGDDQQQHIEFTRQVARRWNLCFSALAAATPHAAASAAAAPCASIVASAAADLPPELLRPPTRLGARRVCGRLGDLGDPSVKMSKSSSRPFENSTSRAINQCGGSTRLRAKGCIFLSDPPDIIAAKIAAAKTDNEQEQLAAPFAQG